MTTILGWLLLCGALILNVMATALLLSSDFESRYQKTVQFSLIWLFPFVGAILVIAVLTTSTTIGKPASGSDASGASLFPGSDGDLNRYGSDDAGPWDNGGHEGHGGEGGGHTGD